MVFQDNKSVIILERNCKNSYTGNSRYVNVRYFFIKDRIDNNEVRVGYLSTHFILADFYAKALQGNMFIEFREYIMGWKPIKELLHKVNDATKSKED